MHVVRTSRSLKLHRTRRKGLSREVSGEGEEKRKGTSRGVQSDLPPDLPPSSHDPQRLQLLVGSVREELTVYTVVEN